MNKSMTVIAAAAILLSSSAFAQTVADCNKVADIWRTAYNNRDADALANMYDAKAGMYSTPFWTASGHDAILSGFKAEMSRLLLHFGGPALHLRLKIDRARQMSGSCPGIPDCRLSDLRRSLPKCAGD